MLKIIDTSSSIFSAYKDSAFVLENWMEYIEGAAPQIKELCLNDMKESVSDTYPWDSYFLPVLDAVSHKKEEVEKLAETFHLVVDELEDKIIKRFGKSLDIDIILYLGLCNGAGWVADVQGKTSILLGIEKILELEWTSIVDMDALILHELGHAYQDKYGILYCDFQKSEDKFMWQLFTEGVAMVFEQEVIGDCYFYHQDRNGWSDWCNQNIKSIANDFKEDCKIMTEENQRYFGDWAIYEGHSDVGYYLGTRFVRYILQNDEFDRIVSYDIDEVKKKYNEFVSASIM